ncbi:hypothetical protein RMATCC62417_10942 [Rhizopus microsporus]|nr:hypothetical protein RMATCC62417_10942 [Rhizopus microsporus]
MTKDHEISIKKLQICEGTEQEVKKMKLNDTFYLKQLGFSQNDISIVIGMKRRIVQAVTDRTASAGTALPGKCTGRFSTFDESTRRHLERVTRRDLFQTVDTLRGELRLMGKVVCRSTVKK